MNSIDAGATRVDVFLPGADGDPDVVVQDDGSGMDLTDLSEQFLSVGGSARFGHAEKFGRIGIGSLALLQYGRTVTLETKKAGATLMCRAELRHSEWIRDTTRRDLLGDIPAGIGREVPYLGDRHDHFTRIRVHDPRPAAREAGCDPIAQAEITERLRRILPLPWPANRLTEALDAVSPEVAEALRTQADAQSAEVVLHSAWDDGVRLSRRHYGERSGIGEDWTGPVYPVFKKIRVTPEGGASRQIIVAGYLLSQTHASAAWSGLTARVQNVAVEEGTFFDVVADPGFRKYITGEVAFLGDVDRERLINIDRASFNRECADYLAAQRFVAEVLQRFKVRHVQQPQRLKVSARRLLQEQAQRVAGIEQVAAAASRFAGPGQGLPSSGKRLSRFAERPLEARLGALGCRVDHASVVDAQIVVDAAGVVVAEIPVDWREPSIEAGGKRYRVRFGDGVTDDLPVVIKNRPREIYFNENHPMLRGKAPDALGRALALEVAYLQSTGGTPDELFERLLTFLAI